MSKVKYLKGLTLDEIKNLMEELGEQKFRGEQLYNWMYKHHAADYEEMGNVPKQLREKLSELYPVMLLSKEEDEASGSTQTKKYLFTTLDNRKIEAVVIPDKERNTLCLSTQVGCPLDCKFCATGLMDYKRNLTPGEIIDQYILACKDFGKDKITNIVYMGMGEPLLNYTGTVKSLAIFMSELDEGLGRNRITVSTSGIAPKIRELADTGLRVKLALSLHSCFEEIRNKIMPINEKYSLKENIEAIKYYGQKTGTRITFEYTMLKGVNDRKEDIDALAKLCNEISAKVNIIPFNSIKHMAPDGLSAQLEPTPLFRIEQFADSLKKKGVTVMLRNTQGDDIAAACGQLAIKN